ncbi:MAG: hypothetical protein IKO91_03330 [Oscillospiraceae bacterium]|nr:hypothetical protein [Oscillospiraceae bacterium]
MTDREILSRALWEAGVLELAEGEVPLRWNSAAALENPQVRTLLLDALEELARDHYAAAEAVLGGTWAALLAERLCLPLNPKELPERLLLAEETVAEGEDLFALAAALRAEGKNVAAAALFNYGMVSARDALDRADVRLHWLTDLETAAAAALQEGIADFETYDRLLELTEG